MSKKIVVSLAATLMLAACAAPTPRTGPDLASGMWGEQSIVPPAGLLTARQGDLIGRPISTPRWPDLMTIDAVLVDPSDGQPDYVVARTRTGYVTIPISVLMPDGAGFYVDASDYSLGALRHMDVAQLESDYPRTTLTPVPMSPPGVAEAYPATGSGAPLHRLRRSGAVGYQVVDGDGAIVGIVDSVAAMPNGEARFFIVSGPSIGEGNYIAVPAASGRTEGNRVVVAGNATRWLQQPHYRSDQLVQVFGPMGDG